MPALTSDAVLTRKIGELANLPVLASTNIYQGAIVGRTAAGYARGFVLGDRFRGHTLKGMDNSAGLSGAKNVETLRGRYALEVALSGVAITDAVFSSPVYAQDDGTLSLQEGLQVGRVIQYVSAGKAVVEFDTERDIVVLCETLAFGDFTDVDATGYIDFATALPKGSIVTGWQANVRTGFTGNTTAVVQVGIAGNLNQFSAKIDNSVLAVAVVGSGPLAVSADPQYLAADTTVRVTVTGATDFTAISAGEMDMRVMYIPRLAV